jgi:transposase
MRKIREVLRLAALGLSARQIARSVQIGRTTVVDHLARARAAGIAWPLPEEVDNEELERRLFVKQCERPGARALPDCSHIHRELRRKHVTLMLLWQEYKSQHPEGYQYSQFCERYRSWAGKLSVWMRQEHRGGDKLFVDYSGDGIAWTDSKTAERHEAQLFVAVLGASNFIYAEASHTQQLRDWIGCHVHALEYIEGVPAAIVPDQTRTAVKEICRYDPVTNPTYADFARHYDTCIFPARPAKPRDKAKAEAGVLLAQRWIIGALRDRTFHSLEEINDAVAECVERINDRKMRKLGRTRRELYLELDKPELRPLAPVPFEFADWKIKARVNLDYHVDFERNYYSVPYQYAHQYVDVRATVTTIEVFLGHRRIASHVRLSGKHRYSTEKDHMPQSHREHSDWTPSRLIRWGATVGPSTARLVNVILHERPHPEQGFRACLGILRLAKEHSNERLEKACARALAVRAHSYRSVDSILKNKLEAQPLPELPPEPIPHHGNVRGSVYYN